MSSVEPMGTETEELQAWLQACRSWVESEMEHLLPAETQAPERLHAAMRYALLGGGKRLRPALCRLVCAALGGTATDAVRPAVAIELVHTYSLVHDDLPCMDDDDLRRGRPTCHRAFDEATAVLAGDALLTQAFLVLAPVQDGTPDARCGLWTRILAQASGSLGMVGGQVLDLALEASGSKDVSREVVAQVHLRKTAALFGAACELGAVAAQSASGTAPPSSSDDQEACASRTTARRFGIALGLAFQAVDDVLDVTGDSSTLGKTPGKDAVLDRPTLVRALGLAAAREEAGRLASEARSLARELGFEPGSKGQLLVDYVLEREA